jgi:hypothetical protein
MIDSKGRMIWIADAHRDDGKHFVARADEKLTAFLELESAICPSSVELSFLRNRAQPWLISFSLGQVNTPEAAYAK